MKSRVKRALTGLALVGTVAFAGLALAGPSAEAKPAPVTPPAITTNHESKPDVLPGSKDNVSPALSPKGATQLKQVNPTTGAPVASTSVTPNLGYNSNVDFYTFYNYCSGNLVYTPVYNYSSATQYFEVVLYANGSSRTYYSSVAANSYAWPYWYGVTGTYYAYLYVWNGSSYAYDEYKTSSNNCSVSISVTKSVYSGYLYATITNNGTAYASVELNELAPYASYGTYTGDHWYYPAAGGGTVNQYIYVGTGQPYGVYATVSGSTYGVWRWSGTY